MAEEAVAWPWAMEARCGNGSVTGAVVGCRSYYDGVDGDRRASRRRWHGLVPVMHARCAPPCWTFVFPWRTCLARVYCRLLSPTIALYRAM